MNPPTPRSAATPLGPDEELRALLDADIERFDLDGGDAPLVAPPADLARSVLDAALAARPHGIALGPRPTTPLDAFRSTVADLASVVASLDDDDWDAPSLPQYGRVRDLIAHLAGVEQHLITGLDRPGDEVEAPLVHVAGTLPIVEALASLPVEQTRRRWLDAAEQLVERAGGVAPTRPVMVNENEITVDGMLVLRTFEVWTHLEDVCAAVGRARPGLDAPRYSLMSSRLADILPTAVLVTHGGHAHGTVRLVLTGPGGGTYDRAYGPGEDVTTPDAVIVADVEALCRAAANRVTRDQLSVTIEGDTALAEKVLTSVGAFAQD